MPAEISSCAELAELAEALGGSVGRMSGEGDVILLSPETARDLVTRPRWIDSPKARLVVLSVAQLTVVAVIFLIVAFGPPPAG